jgi:DNA-binding transcriptional MerR regulator
VLNLKEMVEFTNSVLSKSGVLASPLDIRTVRYYTALGLIEKPELAGRENKYKSHQVKQALAIKILQSAGYSLQQIKVRTQIDDVLAQRGIDPVSIDCAVAEFVASKPQPTEAEQKEEEVIQVIDENIIDIETPTITAGEQVSIEITNGDEYNKIRENLRIGASFVFADKVSGEAATKLHALLYGQKAGGGETSRAVMPVTSTLSLPGATARAGDATKAIAIVLADKDIYREGTDVARLFVFCPTASGEKVKANVWLDGAMLDEMSLELDENGCGLIRVPTLVSGRYEVNVAGGGWVAGTSFESARYELAPFVVTLGSVKKDGSKIGVLLKAESLSNKFSGPARLELMEGEVVKETVSVEFKDGDAATVFSATNTEGALAIRVINEAKPTLIANVPLPGSARAEREETEMSRLGDVVSVSLMPGGSSTEAMGLHYTKTGKTNSPITLKSCVARAAELKFNSDASDVVVFVRDVSTGASFVREVGNVKKGQVKKVQLEATLSVVHVGAFINDQPWEGHAAVVKPAGKGVSLKVAEKAAPGEAIEIDVKGPKGATVLLKIVDKRLRVQYEPIVKAASIIKEAVASVLKGKVTGKVKGLAPIFVPPTRYAYQTYLPTAGSPMTARGGSFRGGPLRSSEPFMRKAKYMVPPKKWESFGGSGLSAGGSSMNINDASPYMTYTGMPEAEKLYSCSVQHNSNQVELCSFSSAIDKQLELYDKQVVSTQTMCEGMGLDYDAEVASIRAEGGLVSLDASPRPTSVKVREVEADVLYCDLVKANRTVVVVLPEVIANYDVKAFAVSKGKWTEAEASIRVEKDCYIEPMIPIMCDPEDGVKAEAVCVRVPERATFEVKIDGRQAEIKARPYGRDGALLTWDCIPGVHEVTIFGGTDDRPVMDRVRRVVEAPGEEIVLTQEMMILKVGERFDLSDDGALSVRVMPGMEQETRVAIGVLTDFGHACCEQSAAMITAAALSLFLGDDSSREKACQLIVKGEARMRGMWLQGKGFKTYPDYDSITPNWSATAGKRLANFRPLLDKDLPADVKKAVESLIQMGDDVVKAHSDKDRTPAPMEDAYYSKKDGAVTDEVVKGLLASLSSASYYSNKSEAAFAAACLIRAKKVDQGIVLANAVAKSMGGNMGGGMHGSYEALAYMHMVDELKNSGIVSGGGTGKVRIDGNEISVKKAMDVSDATAVEAIDCAVALKVSRVQKIDMTEHRGEMGMEISLKQADEEKPQEQDATASEHGDGSRWEEIYVQTTPKAGSLVRLAVKLTEGYKEGDVLCVVLPDSVSRVVSGAKIKKFQMDFCGSDSLSVDLVCHGATDKPQKWAAVVRNMYDPSRIGCVGLMTTQVI